MATTRRQLLDGIYHDFLGEITEHIHDVEKIKMAGIDRDWLDTLIYLQQISLENCEVMITSFGLNSEIKSGHFESALGIVKKFIARVKAL